MINHILSAIDNVLKRKSEFIDSKTAFTVSVIGHWIGMSCSKFLEKKLQPDMILTLFI